MADDAPADAAMSLDARAERALAALLAISASDAAAVRDRSPARRRPTGRYGPVLDLGSDGVGPPDPVDGSEPPGPAARP